MAVNPFYYLDSATLTTLLTAYTNCLTAIATTGASYSIGGRSLTRSNLEEVKTTIAQIKAAQRFQSGARVTTTYADFRRG